MTANAPRSAEEEAVVETARRVLHLESEALEAFSRQIPDDFYKVVQLILAMEGRVILSGIGKSGHIARKISSTLASTGTPSYFVHPSEASHGDLGVITAQDICILISNSGDSAELGDIVAYTRRFAIPLIGISRSNGSALMKAADFRLTLPHVREACAIGMAPTTSTTLTMALGDALSVALMEQRGFLSEQFRTIHPGGKLGAQLSRVDQLMHGPDALALVAPDTPMSETLIAMTEKGFGIACLVENDQLTGIISDGDLRRNIKGLMDRTAGQVATRNPRTVAGDTMAAEALGMMDAAKVNALIIVDDANRPVGILRIYDCLRAGVA